VRILVAAAFQGMSPLAHAINTIKMAQGFARLGHEVTLLCCRGPRGNPSTEAFFHHYGVAEPIRLMRVPQYAGLHFKFALIALPHILLLRPDLIYSRNYILPWLTSKIGYPTIGESHAHPTNRTKPFQRYVSATHQKMFRAWITISPYLAEQYYAMNVPRGKIKVLPDAVDLELFSRTHKLPPSPYPSDVDNVVYSGHLYDYKGIPTILEAARMLPDINFHMVGGLADDIERQQIKSATMGLDNVVFHGSVAHTAVPNYLWHASILLLPPSALHPSSNWTSPVKLGEYLASGVPIVATRIPALEQLVTDREVDFVAPDNPEELAESIQNTLSKPQAAKNRVAAALAKAETLSYTHRADQILKLI